MPASTESLRIAFLDDRDMVADAFAELLKSRSGFAATTHAAGIRALVTSAETPPHVLIVQADLRDADPFAAARTARLAWPRVRVIFLWRDLRDSLLDRAVRARVDGMVTDREPFAALVSAIRTVAAGRQAYSPTVAARLRRRGNRHADGSPQAPGMKLTPREFDVLNHLASGRSVGQASESLGISRATIYNHKVRLMRKVGVDSTVALTRYAIREGLIAP